MTSFRENMDKYRQHCLDESSIPIFSRDWWLDSVCGKDNWDIVLLEKSGRIIGSMPYYTTKRFGFTFLTHPPLTQTLGPWIRPSTAKYAKRLGYQKKVMAGLIKQLPKFDYFAQNFDYSIINWLPFYWNGFEQTTRYTYVLPKLNSEETLWSGLEENTRREIRKATNRYQLKVRDDLGFDAFWELNKMTFERQEEALPYTGDMVKRLDSACTERCCRKIWIAEDEMERHHACAYIVWDENSAYYLMGGGNTELRKSGATSFVMWEAIKHAATVTQKFDFEGSMIEPLERFFRAFGAKQTPYLQITKTTSKLLKFIKALKC